MIISNEKIAPPAATVPHGTVDAAGGSTSHHNPCFQAEVRSTVRR